jgi:hypothetical protein
LFWLIAAAVVAGHSAYWFGGGPDIGARYWYQLLLPLVVLTSRGIFELARRPALGAASVASLVAFGIVSALLTFVPWRCLEKYYDYRGIGADIDRLAKERKFGHSVVFVKSSDPSDYTSALIFNPPTLASPGAIYARDVGPARRAAIATSLGRTRVWIVARSGPHHRFQVIAGPLGPEQAAQVELN